MLKPSEQASVTCLELAAIIDEVGLPPGVFNVVTGLGPEAGAALRCAKHLCDAFGSLHELAALSCAICKRAAQTLGLALGMKQQTQQLCASSAQTLALPRSASPVALQLARASWLRLQSVASRPAWSSVARAASSSLKMQT